MSENYEKLIRGLDCVRQKTDFIPEVAIILGSGLGAFAETADISAAVDYREIVGYPVSTVPGHKGRFIFGTVDGVRVVIMQGRVHYYEGYPLSDVVLPTRLMGLMGAKTLFLTNAAGGVNRKYSAGDFMLIKDHVMTFFPNPLIGENIDRLGTRFPDMSSVYDPALRAVIRDCAAGLGIPLHQGVYAQLTGPSFETPAEIRMFEALGIDAVGMSTACEAVAARHMGLRVCGISCISNKAAGISDKPLTHSEVQETADRAAPLFQALIRSSISAISKVGD